MIKKGDVIKVRRGLYLPRDYKWYSMKTLANIIYGPSYISFESALSHYGLIPENVPSITSACFNKNKNKTFKTPVGTFIYRYTNPKIYPYGIRRLEEGDGTFMIASPEKALCDMLSKIRGVADSVAFERLINDDLRIDINRLKEFDISKVKFLSDLYKKKIIRLLFSYLEETGR